MHSSPMLRKARGILGHANIDVTQNVYGWLAITVASFGFQFWEFRRFWQSLFSVPPPQSTSATGKPDCG